MMVKLRVVIIIGLLAISGSSQNSIPKAEYPPMGRAMRAEFLHNPDYTPLNHGAYGTFPKAVKTALLEAQERIESNADYWIRVDARIEMDKIRERVAAILGCSPEDVVCVPNTTSGINAILRSMDWKSGDKIMHFSTVYGAMKSLIHYMSDTSDNLTSIEFPVTYPISNELLLEQFRQFVSEHHRPDEGSPIRLALFDHLTSNPHVINPIEEMVPFLKSRGVLVLIDAAHAVGQIPINLTSLAPDYITNAHKWLYSARSAALLYVAKERQASIHPAIISSNYDKNGARFQDEFFWTGTVDYSPYMTIPAALQFREDVGGEAKIMNYTHNLALEGGQYLAERFNTRVLQEENQMGSCVDVQLPIQDVNNPLIVDGFWDQQLFQRQIFTGTYKHGGYWWIRVSAQIYNDMQDFVRAGEVFMEICEMLNNNSNSAGGRPAASSMVGAVALGYVKSRLDL